MSDIHEIAYSKAAIWQLGLLAGVAAVAYVARNKQVFQLGGFGILCAYVVPRRTVYTNYQTVEAAFIGAIDGLVEHLVFWAFIGAVAGVCTGMILSWRKRRKNSAATDASISE
jgi:hypothetical protein